MYYVTITARRKNAKRHIKAKFELYNMALKYATRLSYLNSKYIIEIYDGRWNPVYKEESYALKKGRVNSYYGMAVQLFDLF